MLENVFSFAHAPILWLSVALPKRRSVDLSRQAPAHCLKLAGECQVCPELRLRYGDYSMFAIAQEKNIPNAQSIAIPATTISRIVTA